METDFEKQLYFKGIFIDLKQVIYEKKDIPNQNINNIEVNIKDSFSIENENIEGFGLTYERVISFTPDYLFELKVIYEVKYLFADKTKDEFKDNFIELKNLIYKKGIKAINMAGIPSKASALISNITMQNGANPIVTPPSFKE